MENLFDKIFAKGKRRIAEVGAQAEQHAMIIPVPASRTMLNETDIFTKGKRRRAEVEAKAEQHAMIIPGAASWTMRNETDIFTDGWLKSVTPFGQVEHQVRSHPKPDILFQLRIPDTSTPGGQQGVYQMHPMSPVIPYGAFPTVIEHNQNQAGVDDRAASLSTRPVTCEVNQREAVEICASESAGIENLMGSNLDRNKLLLDDDHSALTQFPSESDNDLQILRPSALQVLKLGLGNCFSESSQLDEPAQQVMPLQVDYGMQTPNESGCLTRDLTSHMEFSPWQSFETEISRSNDGVTVPGRSMTENINCQLEQQKLNHECFMGLRGKFLSLRKELEETPKTQLQPITDCSLEMGSSSSVDRNLEMRSPSSGLEQVGKEKQLPKLPFTDLSRSETLSLKVELEKSMTDHVRIILKDQMAILKGEMQASFGQGLSRLKGDLFDILAPRKDDLALSLKYNEELWRELQSETFTIRSQDENYSSTQSDCETKKLLDIITSIIKRKCMEMEQHIGVHINNGAPDSQLHDEILKLQELYKVSCAHAVFRTEEKLKTCKNQLELSQKLLSQRSLEVESLREALDNLQGSRRDLQVRYDKAVRQLLEEQQSFAVPFSLEGSTATPTLLESTVKATARAISAFASCFDCYSLARGDEPTRRIIREEFSNVCFASANHHKLAAKAKISAHMYEDFEKETFATLEEPSPDDPAALQLRSAMSFTSFQRIKGSKSTISLLRYLKPNFENYCRRAFDAILQDSEISKLFNEAFLLREESALPGNKKFLKRGRPTKKKPWPGSQADMHLCSAFLVAAREVWALHSLCLSFDPPAKIIRVDRGADFDCNLLQAVASNQTNAHVADASSDGKVGFMIFPGFLLRQYVIKSEVYPEAAAVDVSAAGVLN